MSFINNLPTGEVFAAGKVTVDHFKAGEGLATHTDAVNELATVLSGSISVELGGKTYKLDRGQSFVFKANTPHSLKAEVDSEVFLHEA